jgi:hypothetical protein
MWYGGREALARATYQTFQTTGGAEQLSKAIHVFSGCNQPDRGK